MQICGRYGTSKFGLKFKYNDFIIFVRIFEKKRGQKFITFFSQNCDCISSGMSYGKKKKTHFSNICNIWQHLEFFGYISFVYEKLTCL